MNFFMVLKIFLRFQNLEKNVNSSQKMESIIFERIIIER